MKIQKVNIAEKLAAFTEHWSPKIIGSLNEQHVKLAKLKGDFVRHMHEFEDEMFLVLKGTLRIELDDETITLAVGEFVIIPAGVYHKPIAEEEVSVLLFEPATTLNTGDVRNEMTVEELGKL